jgi:hypothetical protein
MLDDWNQLTEAGRTWRVLVRAAKKGAEKAGYKLSRVPGRGLANVWNVEKDAKALLASIRTTRDRHIAFPPLEGGKKWKTLDDVDLVIIAATDSKKDPKTVEVYIFPASDVRKRFDASYAARIKEGFVVRDDFGMWLPLDPDSRPSRIGSGIIKDYERVALYPMEMLMAEAKAAEWSDGDGELEATAEGDEVQPTTIAEVIAWAKEQVARIAGVRVEAVKLDLKVEY